MAMPFACMDSIMEHQTGMDRRGTQAGVNRKCLKRRVQPCNRPFYFTSTTIVTLCSSSAPVDVAPCQPPFLAPFGLGVGQPAPRSDPGDKLHTSS